jgi:2-dehydropantoate 2-reductase
VKVCVVGAGAIGTFLGVHLAKSGCEVAALARGRTLAAVRAAGLRLQQDGALLTAPVRAAEDAAALGRQDLVVVAVKGPSLPAAAALVSPLLGPDTVVLAAMNGFRGGSSTAWAARTMERRCARWIRTAAWPPRFPCAT